MAGRMDDGHQTLVTFPENSSILLWEKELTPPGVEGGGENDTTVMDNSTYRTKSPKSLITMSDMSLIAAYDPAVYDDIIAIVNVNQLIVITWPDDSTLQFWGWIDEFKPGSVEEGSQPTADVTIKCSNQNDSGVETAPVHAA